MSTQSNADSVRDSGLRWLARERHREFSGAEFQYELEQLWDPEPFRCGYASVPLMIFGFTENGVEDQIYDSLDSILRSQLADGRWLLHLDRHSAYHFYSTTFFLAASRPRIDEAKFARYQEYLERARHSFEVGRRDDLKLDIVQKGLLRAPTAEGFKLSSGKTSKTYFNLKNLSFSPQHFHILGEYIWQRLRGRSIDAIGGPEVGGVPLALATGVFAAQNGRPDIRVFGVKKDRKSHGVEECISGNPVFAGDRVVLVEDVITTGGSVIRAVEAVRNLSCTIDRVVCLLDRREYEPGTFEKLGIELEAIFTIDDLRDFL